MPVDGIDRAGDRGRFADDLDIRVPLERLAQAHANELVIIHKNATNPCRDAGSPPPQLRWTPQPHRHFRPQEMSCDTSPDVHLDPDAMLWWAEPRRHGRVRRPPF